ncbi:MBL fold metallo-hydrolase [Loktanella sp. Alg231-35]|uniref:MBL fold metallo-hydrolase n=1 Tax=Loktanella sp. Alg231-35 TaxID=1922220 RepID=UPI000D55E18F|nr:MBL fold metallo-hydrolase [Loktanella sp. Alg231-35]
MSNTNEFAPVPGEPLSLADDLVLVLAPNPSPMTYLGTNSYLVGRDTLAVIDPGPADDMHLAALLKAINGRPVEHILLTHSHLDHSPLARPLARATGAPVLAFGDSSAGRSAAMMQLAQDGLVGGGEGIDPDFQPDQIVTDGAVIAGNWGTVTAHHTPGHIGNHLCFAWGDAMFTGDHVMGWASSLVSPPDGDLTDFMASCDRLAAIKSTIYYPGHGAPIQLPMDRLQWLITHRKGREAQILRALSQGHSTTTAITQTVYDDVQPALLPAAERNVLAHLIDLYGRGMITAQPALSAQAEFNIRKTKTPPA